MQRFNGTGNGDDMASSLAVDASGNVYVTGTSYSAGTYDDIVTIKYNSSGVQQWVQVYNGPGNGNDGASKVAIDGNGNAVIAGWSNGGSTGIDIVTLKYGPNGAIQWVQRYNGPSNGDDYSSSMALDISGNIYVAGSTAGIGTGLDYTTIKYNSLGDQQWVRRYNYVNAGNDYARSIAVDKSGNSYVAGYFYVPTTQYNYATLKYDSSGTQQW